MYCIQRAHLCVRTRRDQKRSTLDSDDGVKNYCDTVRFLINDLS